MINDRDITFVIQGPIHDQTKQTVLSIKQHFPSSQIIISTWVGEKVDSLDVDLIIESNDIGPTIKGYKNAKPSYANINRQIVSSINGLKSVKTRYSVKIRSDNALASRGMLKYFEVFDKHRSPNYSLFSQRIVTSNYFSAEYEQGVNIPFVISDLFQFGETKDLIDLWDIKLFDDYVFNSSITAKLQHSSFPFRQPIVEQKIWLRFINKHRHIAFKGKFANKKLRELSYKLMLNNVVIVDGDLLGLIVPKRFEQSVGFPYKYFTYLRWQYLYNKYFNLPDTISKKIVVKWAIAKIYRFISKGWRSKLKDMVSHLKIMHLTK